MMPSTASFPSPSIPVPAYLLPPPRTNSIPDILCQLCDYSTEILQGLPRVGLYRGQASRQLHVFRRGPPLNRTGSDLLSTWSRMLVCTYIPPPHTRAEHPSFHGIAATANTSHAPRHFSLFLSLSLSLSPSPSQDIAPEAHSCTGILCHAGPVSAKSSRTRAQRGGETGAYIRPLQSRADSQCGGSYFAGQWGERGIDSSVAPGTTLVRGTRAPSGMDTRTLLARRLALSFQSWGMGREYDATST